MTYETETARLVDLKGEEWMSEGVVTFLKCDSCGHVRYIDDELLDRLKEATSSAEPSDVFGFVSRVANTGETLFCSKCGGKKLTVGTMDLRELATTLVKKERSWIHQKEKRFLVDVLARIDSGEGVYAGEVEAIVKLRCAIDERKRPRFYRGGNPGSGKRAG